MGFILRETVRDFDHGNIVRWIKKNNITPLLAMRSPEESEAR
jgi:hypothetical protein